MDYTPIEGSFRGWKSVTTSSRRKQFAVSVERGRGSNRDCWPYTENVKIFAFLFLGLGLGFAQRDGNFNIRFEPTATVQTGVQIPFRINVDDDRHKAVRGAKVTLEITTKEALDTKLLPATETDPGTYIAKPVFPHSGEWNVYVEVDHDGAKSTRTKQVLVP